MTKPCLECGKLMHRVESGAQIGDLTGDRVCHKWRWYCPYCQSFPSGGSTWDGERITTFRITQTHEYIEYSKVETPKTGFIKGADGKLIDVRRGDEV